MHQPDPRLVRYLLSHLVVGCMSGLVATAGFIATDVGSLRDLMQQCKGGWLAAALLAVGLSGTFGVAAMGCAISQIGERCGWRRLLPR
jgi:hypothetical protein